MENVLAFLDALTKHNDREWFQENKELYTDSYNIVEDLVNKLIQEVNAFDKSVGYPNPRKLIFRIYRDTRFSSNKDPYKTNFGAVICPEEYKSDCNYAAYYIHIENNNSFVSTGVYMPDKIALKKIRDTIDSEFDDFSNMVNNKTFVKEFGSIIRPEDSLKRPPTGFSKDLEGIDFIKMKNFYVFKSLSNKDIVGGNLDKIAVDFFKKSHAFKDWLNKSIYN